MKPLGMLKRDLEHHKRQFKTAQDNWIKQRLSTDHEGMQLHMAQIRRLERLIGEQEGLNERAI